MFHWLLIFIGANITTFFTTSNLIASQHRTFQHHNIAPASISTSHLPTSQPRTCQHLNIALSNITTSHLPASQHRTFQHHNIAPASISTSLLSNITTSYLPASQHQTCQHHSIAPASISTSNLPTSQHRTRQRHNIAPSYIAPASTTTSHLLIWHMRASEHRIIAIVTRSEEVVRACRKRRLLIGYELSFTVGPLHAVSSCMQWGIWVGIVGHLVVLV